jgi:serine/threonine-protein phosphatase 2A activator
MIKMYVAEVLNKLPVVQHFLFGSILLYDGPPRPTAEENGDEAHQGHGHVRGNIGGAGQQEVGWGDCCGIHVPSAFAAAKAEQDKLKQPGLKLSGPGIRPVPFD